MEVLLHFEQESNGNLNIFGRKNEEAVLSVLGREFGITEGTGGGGQTTLAGMGVGGNVLVRLGFRKVGASPASSGPIMNMGSLPPIRSPPPVKESSMHINTIGSISRGGSSDQWDTTYPRQPMPSPTSSRSASPEPGSRPMDIPQKGHVLSPGPSNTAPSPEPRSQAMDIDQRGQVLGGEPSDTLQYPPPSLPPASLPATDIPAQASHFSYQPASSTQSESPELIPTPPEPLFQEPVGPQNRKRIIYTAASASTPAAAKRTFLVPLYSPSRSFLFLPYLALSLAPLSLFLFISFNSLTSIHNHTDIIQWTSTTPSTT